jgi:hypothetical protein
LSAAAAGSGDGSGDDDAAWLLFWCLLRLLLLLLLLLLLPLTAPKKPAATRAAALLAPPSTNGACPTLCMMCTYTSTASLWTLAHLHSQTRWHTHAGDAHASLTTSRGVRAWQAGRQEQSSADESVATAKRWRTTGTPSVHV